MSKVLYLKWRPQTWDQVVGQEHIVRTLRNAVRTNRVAHAYLFAGPRGTGKTSVARILAKAVNCLVDDPGQRPCDQCAHCLAVNAGRFIDLIEIDAASNTSVDDVRDLRDKINFTPNLGRYKFYIIDEVHMLSTAAFNALLKTLEEPPPHALFVLATTEVHKIPATVLSRCQRHEFRRLPVNETVSQLQCIAAGEGIHIRDAALQLIARQATGSLRDAISLLDQLTSLEEEITLETAQAVLGTATEQTVLDMVEALIAGETAQGLDHLHQALDAGSDPRQLARQMVDYLRQVLLVKVGELSQIDVTQDLRQHMSHHAKALPTDVLLRLIRLFNSAASHLRGAWLPALPLEMAFMEAVLSPVEVQSTPRVSTPPQGNSTPTGISAGGSVPKPSPGTETHPANPHEPHRINLSELRGQWPRIKALLKKSGPQIEGLLSSCRSLNLKNGILELGFTSGVIKEKMEREGNIEKMRWAIEQVFGQQLPIRCVLIASNHINHKLPAGVDQDGMIKAALDLGGEIVDV